MTKADKIVYGSAGMAALVLIFGLGYSMGYQSRQSEARAPLAQAGIPAPPVATTWTSLTGDIISATATTTSPVLRYAGPTTTTTIMLPEVRRWDLLMVVYVALSDRNQPPMIVRTFSALDACEYAKASLRLDYDRSSQFKASTAIFSCAEKP